jgi:ABC-type phosphate transport system substrate-binding protein
VVLTRGLVLVPVLAFALSTSGCGGGSSSQAAAGTSSCTVSESVTGGGSTLASKICEEAEDLTSAQAQQFMQQCTLSAGNGGLDADAGVMAQAIYVNGPCSHDGALGGCRLVQGGQTSVGWYYQMGAFTSADIMQLCANAGATFVPP